MGIPVLHAGSLLPAMPAEADAVADDPALGAYTRRVTELDYDIEWVDLLEMDGVAPYTYSEELPYDELLQQHTPGVLSRTPGAEEREARRLVIAALPREDSPTAARYVREREGETAWTMHIKEGDLMPELPAQVRAQMEQKEHTPFTFDPNARSADRCSIDQPLPVLDHAVTLDELPAGYVPPQLDE